MAEVVNNIIRPVTNFVKNPSVGTAVGLLPFAGSSAYRSMSGVGVDPFNTNSSQMMFQDPNADLNPRRSALRTRISGDKEIDDISRDILLKELNGINTVDRIGGVEEAFLRLRTSQEDSVVSRRQISNTLKQKKDQPGIRAQTVLTGTNATTPTGTTALTGGYR